MLAAYNQIRSGGFWGGASLVAGDVIADDAVTTNSTFDWTQIVAHSMDLFNPPGRNAWNNTYVAINRANVAASSSLADPILASASQDVVNELKADAAYIRALGHFHLVRMFGMPYSDEHKNDPGMGIPIRTRGTTTINESFDALPRSTVEEVYTAVINDLKFAIANLPASRTTASGLATPDAAQALLAKVYFYKGDMTNAAAQARPLMNSGKYALDADIAAKYARAELKAVTKEVIFMIPSTAASDDSWGASAAITGATIQLHQFLSGHHHQALWQHMQRMTSAMQNFIQRKMAWCTQLNLITTTWMASCRVSMNCC